MSHKESGLWCDLCRMPILDGPWWHIGIGGPQGERGHAHEKCKNAFLSGENDFGFKKSEPEKETETPNPAEREK